MGSEWFHQASRAQLHSNGGSVFPRFIGWEIPTPSRSSSAGALLFSPAAQALSNQQSKHVLFSDLFEDRGIPEGWVEG